MVGSSVTKKRSKRQQPSELLTIDENVSDRLIGALSLFQQKIYMDKARFILARCSRRAGKTYFDAAKLIGTCLEYPGDTCVYFGLTKESAKEAIWDQILFLLNKFSIPHKYSEYKLEIELFNGSRIKLIGADLDNIKDRLRGRKFRLVIVDECAFYTSVDNLILSVLLPTLADYAGQLIMTSSPGLLPQGLFYEADQGKLQEQWSRYHWTGGDNPEFQKPALNPKYKNRWEEELDTIVTMQFSGDWEHPTFRREYQGEWVFDNRSLIYPLESKYVISDEKKIKNPQYTIGLSLANQGMQSVTVIKYGEYDREVVVMRSYTFKSGNLDELANEIEELIEEYDAERVVCYLGDNDKDILDDFKFRYRLPMIASTYRKDPFYQQVISTDMQNGYILVMPDSAGPLIEEWKRIVKDDEGEEIEGQVTLLADSFFVVYLSAYNTTLKQIEEKEPDDDIMERQLLEQIRRERDEYSDDYGYNDD